MFKKQLTLLASVLAIVIITLGSCKSKYEKLKASNDYAKKYQEAIKYYNKKDYNKALGLFEVLVERYRGREGAEDLFYYYAFTYYKQKDYTSARYHFKTFADTYPSSPRAEECRFFSAYCYYLDSPIYSLDQDNTLKAIDALQLFINLYPKSDRVAEASKLIQNLRDKLETKAYANAKLYLTISDYQSAVIAFNNALRDYPDTKYGEEMEYLIVKAQYQYAYHSFETKQEDRFNQAIAYADQFAEKYPNSKYLHETQAYVKDSQQGIKQAQRLIAEAMSNERTAKKLLKKDTVTTTSPSEKNQPQKIPY
ncbi:outer membrane protein assembly factor BamD [Mucilaginibacter sp. Mucisp84]|uniref:outer membrane protein assembly factor BamD n=1 Tax=Mucilaginibacter sp. Mucisp84 TaxID=3243058 RepID=UPI0039A70EB6